jgi:hypothetical protein
LKQILRKEQADASILLTANVPAAKKIIVHGPLGKPWSCLMNIRCRTNIHTYAIFRPMSLIRCNFRSNFKFPMHIYSKAIQNGRLCVKKYKIKSIFLKFMFVSEYYWSLKYNLWRND